MKPDSSASSKTSKDEIKRLDVHAGENLDLTIHLEEGSSLNLHIEKEFRSEVKSSFHRIVNPVFQPPKSRLSVAFFHIVRFFKSHWQVSLIGLALAIYLATRFISLDSFPIYFFTDEAIQTNRAAELIQNHWQGDGHELLPTYFINGGQYNLGVSVYAQILPYLVFGKSIWVTRGVSVLLSLLAALAVGLIMRNIFKSRQPFLAILFLSVTPAWFLHSRTAFETVLAVSFYAAFLYCYWSYRQGRIGYLYVSAVFATLSFYSYSPAQVVVVFTLVVLFFMDLPYHWKNRNKLYPLLGLAVLGLFPYIRFVINHPDENLHHLEILDSYWTKAIPLSDKIMTYLGQYVGMLNPLYWFSPQTDEIVRHVMKGYGFLLWWTFPLVGLGLVLTCMRLKKPEYRIMLLTVLAAPTGAALVAPSITRALFMVIPAALLAAIAVDQLIEWLRKIKIKQVLSVTVIFAALAGVNGYMVYDALTNGPTWFQDYGLYGMQYGARQVFSQIKDSLAKNPDEKIFLATNWTNGADIVARFFFNDPLPFKMDSIDGWLNQVKDLNDKTVFVIPPDDWAKVEGNPKFKSIQVVQTIDYPNDKPGFYFVKLAYADNITQQLADEEAARRQLIDGTVTLQDGTQIAVKYPNLDMGKIQDAFDGNEKTLIRTTEANPLVLKLIFNTPYPVNQITLLVGGAPTTANIEVLASGVTNPIKMQTFLDENIADRHINFIFDAETMATEITISVKNTNDSEPDHVHLWEVVLK